ARCLAYPSKLRPSVERRCGLGLGPQICRRLVERHDGTIRRMHIEETHLVANLEAVEAALLDNAYIEAVAGRIHYSGAYTATGGGPRHQYRVNVHLVEVSDEGGPEEATGPTLCNDEVLGLRTNFLDNRVTNMLMFQLCRGQHALARLVTGAVRPGGAATRAGRTGRIDDGHAHLAPTRQKLLDVGH